MLFIHKKDEKGMKKIYSPFTIPLVPYCNNTHVLYDILADIAKGLCDTLQNFRIHFILEFSCTIFVPGLVDMIMNIILLYYAFVIFVV